MNLILKAILGLTIIQGVLGNAPKMLWTDCPDDDACDKCLDVAFESGNDIACLNEKFPETRCILEGNFMNGGSRVFLSSEQCINGGDMDHIQVSFTDSRCPDMAMFEVDAESGFSTSEMKMPAGMVDEVKWPEISEDREESQDREDRTFPANGFTLNLAIRYDNLFAAQFPGNETTKINAVMGHVQTMYNWNSLDANMCLNTMSIERYNGDITTNDLSVLGPHVDTNESEDPNLFVFITHLTPPSGGGSFTVGIAWGGSVCYQDNWNVNGGTNNGKGFRISINSWVSSDLGLSETIAHEIGHNLNMAHDFDTSPGNTRTCTTDGSSCTDIGGIMDYFGTPSKWTCCSNADFKELYDDGLAGCLAECTDTPTTPTPGTTTTKEPGPTTTKGPTPDCQNIPDSYGGAVRSPGYPNDVPNGMDESCWRIGCPGGWTGVLDVTSEVAYKIDYMCSNDFESGEPSSEECEDKWSQKKCQKCNAKKCRKSKSCKKNCQNTCKLCDNRILAPTTTPSPTLAANCTIVDGPSDAIILTSPGYPYGSVSNVYPQCWTVKCGSGNRMLHVKSNLIFELDYLCNDSSEECEDKWAQKKCKKKCNAKKCKKSKSCKKNCQNTCDLCNDRILAPFY